MVTKAKVTLKRLRENNKFILVLKIRKFEKKGWKRGKITKEYNPFGVWQCYLYKDL